MRPAAPGPLEATTAPGCSRAGHRHHFPGEHRCVRNVLRSPKQILRGCYSNTTGRRESPANRPAARVHPCPAVSGDFWLYSAECPSLAVMLLTWREQATNTDKPPPRAKPEGRA